MNRQPHGLRRTTVRLHADVLREIDRRAAARNLSRSAFIAQVLRCSVNFEPAQEPADAAS